MQKKNKKMVCEYRISKKVSKEEVVQRKIDQAFDILFEEVENRNKKIFNKINAEDFKSIL